MSGIYWLASYPKSGNTWFRIVLANLQADQDIPVSINELPTSIASDRALFDRIAGIESAHLLPEEMERLRPQIYRYLVQRSADPLLLKVHDAYTYLPCGAPLFPPEISLGVIYILRNPLDVAVSLAAHFDCDLDTAIGYMATDRLTLSSSLEVHRHQLPQKLSSWSGHVLSWMVSSQLKIHLMRYEDMQRDPLTTFTQTIRFLDREDTPEQIKRAIQFSTFTALQQQERSQGFWEKLVGSKPFFRQGQVGRGREILSADQIERILADHHEVMSCYGYLDQGGKLIY